jgi:hypothetical protein
MTQIGATQGTKSAWSQVTETGQVRSVYSQVLVDLLDWSVLSLQSSVCDRL